VRLAQKVGMRRVIGVAKRFGITEAIPAYLPVALGASGITLQQQVAAFSVFPNGGMLIAPRMVRRVATPEGRTLQEKDPEIKEATSEETSAIMLQFLQEVVRSGTGVAAAQLKHPLGGKTGTTNDFTDAWFIGFSPSVTAGVWLGYDDTESLGEGESGSRAALPIWIDFMRSVIAAHPGEQFNTVRRFEDKQKTPLSVAAAKVTTPPRKTDAAAEPTPFVDSQP